MSRSLTILATLFVFYCGSAIADTEEPSEDPWVEYIQRTESLEAEVAALRKRCRSVCLGTFSVNCIQPGWHMNVDYLNWTLQRSGLDYAIPTTDTALSVGVGQVQHVNFKPDSGYRANLGYLTQSGWEIGFRYTSFDTSAAASSVDTGGNLWATRTHPDRGEEAATADAFSGLDYEVFDLELQRWFMSNENTAVRWLAGLRWADIGQRFEVAYDGRDFSLAELQNPVDLNGFGLRIGGEGHWRLTDCLSLFGRATGTVMRGDFSTRLLETNFAGSDVVVDVTDKFTGTLTAIELAAGAAWQRGPFSLSAGYEMIEWSNLGGRTTFSSATHEGAYDPSSIDVLLEGIFIRGSVLF